MDFGYVLNFFALWGWRQLKLKLELTSVDVSTVGTRECVFHWGQNLEQTGIIWKSQPEAQIVLYTKVQDVYKYIPTQLPNKSNNV